MYTQEDVRKLFMQRGEIEMELKVRQAQYYGRGSRNTFRNGGASHGAAARTDDD